LLDGAVNWDRILLVVGGGLEGVQLHEVGREGEGGTEGERERIRFWGGNAEVVK